MTEAGDFGIMEGAYFVGRKELLSWINTTLDLSYAKIEQAASGAAYCQLMDLIHPRSIAVSQIKFDATQEWEFLHNWRLLQKTFDKVGISKNIDIPKLTKAKHQDNLEFMQWFKRYYDSHGKTDEVYNAAERRAKYAAQPKTVSKIPSAAATASPSKRRASLYPGTVNKENSDNNTPASPNSDLKRRASVVPSATRSNLATSSSRIRPPTMTRTQIEKVLSQTTATLVPEPEKTTVVAKAHEETSEDETEAPKAEKAASPSKGIPPVKRIAKRTVKKPALPPKTKPASPVKKASVSRDVGNPISRVWELRDKAATLSKELSGVVMELEDELGTLQAKLTLIEELCNEKMTDETLAPFVSELRDILQVSEKM